MIEVVAFFLGHPVYWMSPQKVEWQIFSTFQSQIVLASSDKTSSDEMNDTIIIEFGWVVLFLW